MLQNKKQINSQVSIIVPCYNVEDYFKRCIESILRQNYANIEIICINDGSTDNTLNLISSYKQKDSRIKLISQDNKGLSETRNIGMKMATGDWIMFVDSDDYLEPDCISATLKHGYDLICFSYNRVFKNRIEARLLNIDGSYPASEIQRRITGITGEELKDPSQANSLVTAWGKIYNSAILRKSKAQFTSTKIIGTEDALFNIEYLNACKGDVMVIDRPYYNYLRYNAASLTTTYKPNLFMQWNTLHQMIFDIIKDKSPDFHEAYYNRIALSVVGLGLNEIDNPAGISSQYKNLKKIIRDSLYIKSFRQLDFRFFPLHWKILFLFAKYRLSAGVFLMMKVMSFLWKRKNN